VHIYDDTKLAWVDARREAFNTLEEAKLYIDEALTNRKARILEVSERGRHVYNGR
jgi:hypothetical protein